MGAQGPRVLPTAGEEAAGAVAATGTSYLVAGGFSGSIELGDRVLTSNGGQDMLIFAIRK
jgi:hypothetical protein